ncbi:root hair defective 3-like protein [Tanacetum coccineum]
MSKFSHEKGQSSAMKKAKYCLIGRKQSTAIQRSKVLAVDEGTVMVATVRCEEIDNEKYSSFLKNEDWCELEDAVKSHIVPGFRMKLTSMIDASLSRSSILLLAYVLCPVSYHIQDEPGMPKQTTGTLKSVQANGRVDYLADIGFPAQSVGSSNTDVLEFTMLASSHYWNVSKQTTRDFHLGTGEYLSITQIFCAKSQG